MVDRSITSNARVPMFFNVSIQEPTGLVIGYELLPGTNSLSPAAFTALSSSQIFQDLLKDKIVIINTDEPTPAVKSKPSKATVEETPVIEEPQIPVTEGTQEPAIAQDQPQVSETPAEANQ